VNHPTRLNLPSPLANPEAPPPVDDRLGTRSPLVHAHPATDALAAAAQWAEQGRHDLFPHRGHEMAGTASALNPTMLLLPNPFSRANRRSSIPLDAVAVPGAFRRMATGHPRIFSATV